MQYILVFSPLFSPTQYTNILASPYLFALCILRSIKILSPPLKTDSDKDLRCAMASGNTYSLHVDG